MRRLDARERFQQQPQEEGADEVRGEGAERPAVPHRERTAQAPARHGARDAADEDGEKRVRASMETHRAPREGRRPGSGAR